jgi:hypothetical protein
MPNVNQQAYGVCPNLGDMWAITNNFDTATIVGASATAALGPERLRDPRIGKKWRTPVGGATLTITFPAAVPLQVFGIFGITPLTDTTLTLAMGTTIGGSEIRSGAWAPTMTGLTRQGFWLNAVERPGLAAPNVIEIRLGLANVGHAIDLGRVWASDYTWTPTVNHTLGSDQSLQDFSAIQRTRRSGAVLADVGIVQRQQSVKYDAISSAEWNNEVYTISKTTGMNRQLLFIPNYLVYPPYKHAILGYQTALNPIATLGFDRFTKMFALQEAG